MQSSTDAGNDGTRKYPAQHQHQQQQQSVGTAGAGGAAAAASPGATNQTTSFTVNGSTPSKNPFKQQLDNNPQQQQQQNGMEQDSSGIMGLGKEQQQQHHQQPPPLPPQSYGTRQMTTGGQPPPDQYRQEDPRAAGHWSAAKSWMVSWRGSNRLVLVIVAIALLLDNMLLTTVGEWQAHDIRYTIYYTIPHIIPVV